MPWGKPGYSLRVGFLRSLTWSNAAPLYGTTWSSSPCMTSVGTSILFRSSVEVRFRERLDTVVVSLGPANHALAPRIPNNTVHWLGSRSVKPVEHCGREIAVKLS